jgi:mono/diheme cytochrome c family protein
MSRPAAALLGLIATLACAACSRPPELVAPEPGLERMVDQPRGAPYRGDPTAADGAMMRTPPAGTLARDAEPDGPLTTGMDADGYLVHLPIAADLDLLRLGQRRFDVVCAACHGVLGDGDSPVADHMALVRPRNLHEAAIRGYPVGRIFRVITTGYGLMPAHADLLPPRERWAVAAYVKALQLSQHAVVAELPEAQRRDARERLP